MPREPILESVGYQQRACGNLGSPFYAGFLGTALSEACAEDPFWRALDNWVGDPESALLPLRLLAALHHLVLDGQAPELARHFPSTDRDGDPQAAYRVANAVIEKRSEFVADRLNQEIQTNEVRRCAALLPGFLLVGERAGLPMRLAELGASAGLNLCWDRYRYRLGPLRWGDEDAPLELETAWQGAPPPAGPIEISDRRGCDLSPLDITNPDDRTRLRSFVWPDQPERIDLLDRAMRIALDQAPQIETASAGDFVERVLAGRQRGHVTVIYHSIMWLYVPVEERRRIRAAIEAAGSQSNDESPLAWLRMEFDDDEKANIWLDYWPGWPGSSPKHMREKLGVCHYHGTSVNWFGDRQPGRAVVQPVE